MEISMIDGQQAWYTKEIPLSNQVVLDLGANRGDLSQFFWTAGRGSNKVISVEPLPQNYKLIEKKIKKAKAKNWLLERCAVADYAGEMPMARQHSKKYGWNSMNAALTPTTEADDIIAVEVKPLAAIAPEPTVIKMDIEGGEYVILDRYVADLATVNTWAVELHMLPDRPLGQVLALFTNQGFGLIAAGRDANNISGAWVSMPITSQLEWRQIPATNRSRDGREFKMLHIIARRG
jgi:FkbM family methyltransferase